LTGLLVEMRDLVVALNRVTTEIQRDPARFFFGNQQQGYEAQ
jgi:phospholipid/cholesterol/gamma-HCH transport system substrate-binding protein